MNIFEKYPNREFLRGLPDDSEFFPLRERIIDLFQFLDGLEDPHFGHELDRDPHARLWEMMLAKILHIAGHEVTSAPRGPDFVVERGAARIFVEAICPGPGDEGRPNSVPPMVYGAPIAQDVPVDSIVLRIRGALEEKRRKYADYLAQGVISEVDGCIIAVNPSKLLSQASGLWPPAIMRATHGLGNPYVIFGQGEGAVGEGIEARVSIPKVNGPAIDTTFLLSDANDFISAVLYSDCSFFSLDFDLWGKSMFVHNPKARVPLPLGFLKSVREVWTVCCHGGPGWKAYEIESA
jgi:hypothetical protein